MVNNPLRQVYNSSALSSVQPLSLAYGSTAPLVGEPLAGRASPTVRLGLMERMIIGWLREYVNGTPSVRFLSLFNFINNKYSPSIFGMDKSGEAEIWEVEDNVNFFMDYLEEGTFGDSWNCLATTLYYARVPKTSPTTGSDFGKAGNANQVAQANEENYWLRRFHNWIYSCNPHVANRYKLKYGDYAMLPSSVTYGDTTYKKDTPEYRIAKFNAEYAGYMSKESALFYLNFCDNDLCTDSFDKNMSIALVRLKEGGPKIAFFFLRDTDTSKMFNNRGPLAFRFYHEWGDSFDATTGETGQVVGETYDAESGQYSVECTAGTPVYNGRLSGLFDCVNMAWPSDRRAMYQAMRSAGLNAADLIKIRPSLSLHFKSKTAARLSVLSAGISTFKKDNSVITRSPSNRPFNKSIRSSLLSSCPKRRLKPLSTKGLINVAIVIWF